MICDDIWWYNDIWWYVMIQWYMMICDDMWWHMMIYDDMWWYVMTYDDIWWSMMIYDDIRWYTMIYDDIWWYMMIHDDTWWYMMIYDVKWWYMMVYDDIWWYMMIYDDIWWYVMIYVEIYDIFLAARLEPHQATEEGTSAMCLLDHVSSSLGTKMCPGKRPRQLKFDLDPRKVASGNYMKLWPWIMANRKTLLLIGQSKYSKCLLHVHIICVYI